MPVQATFPLNSKNYLPRGRQGDVAQWQLVGDATFGGATSTLQESVRGPSKDGITRVRWNLLVPKAAAADSACGCVGQILAQADADIQVRIPSTFSTAERQDFVDRVQAAVASAVFDASISALEPSW